LADDPAPLEALIHSLFSGFVADQLRNFYIPDDAQKAPPPSDFDPKKLVERIRTGATWLASVHSTPGTPDAEEVEISVGTVGAARSSRSLTKCRYALTGAFGPAQLARIGVSQALDAILTFAGAVAVRAGVLHWATTTVYASCLASGGGSNQLTREQNSHITDLLYWQPRWGNVIRGPQWGTFLAAEHVRALGGIDAITRESGCARVIALRSGGAFLQATALDEPIVEDTNNEASMARLAAYLTPVMGRRT
jgi:hypothetical protein